MGSSKHRIRLYRAMIVDFEGILWQKSVTPTKRFHNPMCPSLHWRKIRFKKWGLNLIGLPSPSLSKVGGDNRMFRPMPSPYAVRIRVKEQHEKGVSCGVPSDCGHLYGTLISNPVQCSHFLSVVLLVCNRVHWFALVRRQLDLVRAELYPYIEEAMI